MLFLYLNKMDCIKLLLKTYISMFERNRECIIDSNTLRKTVSYININYTSNPMFIMYKFTSIYDIDKYDMDFYVRKTISAILAYIHTESMMDTIQMYKAIDFTFHNVIYLRIFMNNESDTIYSIAIDKYM